MYLDVIDIQILDLLKENSRSKLTELGQKLNVTPATVKYRIDRLVESGIIDKFTISLNQKRIGYEILAYIVVYANSKVEIGNIIHVLRNFSQISRISVLMGDPDLLAKTALNNMKELVQLLNKISRIEQIKTYKTWFVTEEIN